MRCEMSRSAPPESTKSATGDSNTAPKRIAATIWRQVETRAGEDLDMAGSDTQELIMARSCPFASEPVLSRPFIRRSDW